MMVSSSVARSCAVRVAVGAGGAVDTGVTVSLGVAVGGTAVGVGGSVGGGGTAAGLQAVNTTRITSANVVNRDIVHMLLFSLRVPDT